MRKGNESHTAPRTRKYGWRHMLRERSWAVLSVIVAVTTITNVSSLSALIKPQSAFATFGKVAVNKQVDLNGDGDWNDSNEKSNSTANNLGFRWKYDNSGSWRNMGTDQTATIGNHTATENSVSGYHLVGWYVDEGSCSQPEGTTLPVTVSVSLNDTDTVTFCNAKDSKGTVAVNKQVDLNGDGDWSDTNEKSNSTANNLGFRWKLDNTGDWRNMGTNQDVTVGDHQVAENSVSGYHLVGWFVDDGSCTRPEGTTLPVTVGVSTNDTDTVTFCNAKDDEGTIKVNKKVDADGNGSFEGGNTTANNLGIRWGYDNNAATRNMGTDVDVATGNHTVTENSVSGYHFVGWYPTGSEQYSCSNPKGTELPVNLSVTKNHTTEITLCNAKNDERPMTLKAWKIVCSNEADLPNWGLGGPDITSTTAQNWVNSHASCSFASDWSFQWAPDPTYPGNPGDNTGAAGAPWTTFGPTNASGVTTATVPYSPSMNLIWVREVWQNGYIPFTYNAATNDNTNSVSAEMYCHTDVVNYDNFDWIHGLQAGATYYCVAWNVLDHGTVTVTKKLDNDGDGVFETTNPKGWTWNLDQDTGFAMGDTQSATPGAHVVDEAGPSEGYHFAGWFPTNSDYSCTNLPEGEQYRHLPINITVTAGQNTAVTICNGRDTGSITGTKYYDWNRDGQADENDQTIADWNISLYRWYGEGSSFVADTTTDANGDYTFTDLSWGDYLVCETVPNGWAPTGLGSWKNVNDVWAWCQEATVGSTYDFHNYRTGTIHGLKFNDYNGDGIWNDETNPLTGWTIFIDQNDNGQLDNGEPSKVTDGWDGYTFTDLAPGVYTVCEVQQSGWKQTYPKNDGQAICHTVSVNTDAASTCDYGQPDVSLQSVAIDQGPMCNFGNQEQATVTVKKNVDLNGDGDVTDPNETNSTAWTWDLNGGNQNFATGSTQTVTPGATTVTEDNQTNFSFVSVLCVNDQVTVRDSVSATAVNPSATFETVPGGHYTCTFTNARDTGTIELKKVWSGTGAQVTLNIGTSVGGTQVDTQQTGAAGAAPLTTGANTVVTGTYFVSETGTPTNYVSALACTDNGTAMTVGANDSVAVTKGHAIVCTFTNRELVPQVLGVSAEADLTLTKSVNKDTATPGTKLTYTLVVTNTGEADATNVVVTDNLPDGFVFLAGGKSTRTWNLGTLAAGTSKTLTYKVLVGKDVIAGQHVNRAFVTADFFDPIVAQAIVTVKVPQVLGLADTGAGLQDLLTFVFGFVLLAAGSLGFRKLRRGQAQA